MDLRTLRLRYSAALLLETGLKPVSEDRTVEASPTSENRITTTRAILGGAVASLVIAGGFGIAILIATGLNMGLVLGIDGRAQSVSSSAPAVVPALVVCAAAALLFASQEIWWAPVAGRITAGAITVAVIVVGSLQYDEQYYRNIGVVPWWEIVVIASSQSMLSYAFVGMVIATLVIKAGARRGNMSP